jgi:Domain of unknown function (DUF4111)/Nucleotidyltransferase domain
MPAKPADVPPEVLAYAHRVAVTIAAMRPDLVGVYLHGSAALGGFRPAVSDVDLLAVVREPGPTPAARRAMGDRIAAVDGCPGTGVEMSVITSATAAELGACPFEVHVNTAGREPVIVTGTDHAGDPDLVLHCAVCREHAIAVEGPPASATFGPVPRDRVLAAMRIELEWALHNASTAYTVLNACRAARFAAVGTLCSKVDGGDWYIRQHGHDPVVAAALACQRHGEPGPAAGDAAAFVGHLDAAL